MSKSKADKASQRRLAEASMEVEQAKKRLASTMGALQYRLKPATLMNNAWEGVRDKSGEVADDAFQAVKRRPGTISGILAAIVLFIAREPLWRLILGLFTDEREADRDTVPANLEHDENYDITAPTVERSRQEGVNA